MMRSNTKITYFLGSLFNFDSLISTDELTLDNFCRDHPVVIAAPNHGTDAVALVKHIDVVKVEGQNRLVTLAEEAPDFLGEGRIDPGPQGRDLWTMDLVTGVALCVPPPLFRCMIESFMAAGTGPPLLRHSGPDHVFREAG